MEKQKFNWLRYVVHAGAIITFAVLAIRYFTGNLSVNPIQTLEQQTGKTALIFLVLSLACSPLGAILGWRELSGRKKALGLYGFAFAAIHLLIYLGLDFGFQFKFIFMGFLNSVYLWIGLAAFLILSALAITSFKKMKLLLKRNWKRLHRLVYILSPLVVLHYILTLKNNFVSLQGNITEPLIYGVIVLLLLILRIPPIKTALINLRIRLQNRRLPV